MKEIVGEGAREIKRSREEAGSEPEEEKKEGGRRGTGGGGGGALFLVGPCPELPTGKPAAETAATPPPAQPSSR